jgi:ABC-2 type transport system permease protein
MGTLRRLQLSKLSAFSFLGGISLSQVLLGTIAISLTFLVALSLGFRSQGALWVAILVGALTSLSIMGIGMIVASFARSVTEAFLLSNFPLFLLMFFSGAIRPIPKLPLFTLGGREIGLYDFLQPTHAVVALNKILTLGASLGDVLFELLAVLILAALYFVVGVILFHYRRMRVV